MAKATWAGNAGELLRAGTGLRLADVDPASTPGFRGSKADGKRMLEENGPILGALQEKLFASDRHEGGRSVLLVLQAMDTAGKGGIVRHALVGVDPQGIQAHAFKAPTAMELRHRFLWRIRRELPRPGYLGVFDRSHYEDVLVHRVRELSSPEVIEERYGQIAAFERRLAASGTTIVKVMLHISAREQKARLQERLDRPEKNWKFNPGDIDERAFWPAYQEAYEVAIERTSTDAAPWFVVPADKKYYARLAVQRLVTDALTSLDLAWPTADYDVEAQKKRLAASTF